MWRKAAQALFAKLKGAHAETSVPVAMGIEEVVDLASLRTFLGGGGLAGRRALALPCRRYAGSRFAHELGLRPEASSLRELGLAEDRLGLHGARALAQSTALAGLEALDLSGNQLGDAGTRALAESPHLSALTTLNLAGNRIGDEGARALAQSRTLTRLKVLRLSGNRLGPEAARALAESSALASLEVLDLSGNHLGDDGARALSDGRGLAALTALGLGRARLTARALWALASSDRPRLLRLELKRNRIDASGVSGLAGAPFAGQLVELGLACNPLGDDGARALAAAQVLVSLTALNLTRTGLTDEGARALTEAPLFRTVKIELRGNRIAIARIPDENQPEGEPPAPDASAARG